MPVAAPSPGMDDKNLGAPVDGRLQRLADVASDLRMGRTEVVRLTGPFVTPLAARVRNLLHGPTSAVIGEANVDALGPLGTIVPGP